ncbi:MAG: sodium:alanine symporter family protein [Clostridia bacterium]|nr:sodium:alanine symporter family protein [Clostridia bacterium]
MALISFASDFIISPSLVSILIFSGIYMSVKLRFFHLTRLPSILKSILRTKGASGRSPTREVTVALAGTLGVGNLMGVAAAIALGGAGAVFWMWVGALLSMVLKYSEIVLALATRTKKNGAFIGGAMYYLKSGAARRIFALLCICTSFTLGAMLQTDAVSECFDSVLGVSPVLCGALLSLAVFLIIIGGHSWISRFTSIVIPIACAVYIIISCFVIFTNVGALPKIFANIFSSAFTFSAASGGVIGSLICFARPIRYGISRGLITNEAGCGTAPIAHAAADTEHPAAQGFWGLFEVFADTVVLCTLSALVILIAAPNLSEAGAMDAVLSSFSKYCGSSSDYILSISVLFFAVAGTVGWFYYGLVGLDFLLSEHKYYSASRIFYCIAYSLCVFLGAVCPTKVMWDLTDVTVGLMAIINTPCILSNAKEISRLTLDFFSK